MQFLKKYQTVLTWITLLLLTNILTVYFLINGLIKIPNTLVLENSSEEFLYEVDKLNQLNNVINHNYTGEVDNTQLGETLLDTMFTTLGDPYSDYYTKEEYKEIESSTKGSFGGIGVVIDGSNPEEVKITSVVNDSPAEKAGIKENDIIKKVNGEDITGQALDVIVSKTRGEIGTDVTITVERDGQEKEFTLTRNEISGDSVFSENLDGIGYIYISEFSLKTEEQFKKAVDELKSQNVTDLIIDLRANGGGIVNSAVAVADLLLDRDIIGYSIDKNGNKETFSTNDGKIDLPFVILVDENTASASELLAGGVQKSGGTIIGTKTFGKGVIQAMIGLDDGSGYKLTFQEYFLKDDSKVNKTGITPNIEVQLDESALTEDPYSDNQIAKALEILRNN